MSTLVPAAPGTYLLHSSFSDGQIYTDRAPIIAWRIDVDEKDRTIVEPITSTDATYFTRDKETLDLGVLATDGRVYALEDPESFDSLEKWQEYMQRLANRRKEKAAAKSI